MGLLDFVAGYALGGKAGQHGFDQMVATAKEVWASREFQAMLQATRAHAAATLRQLSDVVEGQQDAGPATENVLDLVKALMERRGEGFGFKRTNPT